MMTREPDFCISSPRNVRIDVTRKDDKFLKDFIIVKSLSNFNVQRVLALTWLTGTWHHPVQDRRHKYGKLDISRPRPEA